MNKTFITLKKLSGVVLDKNSTLPVNTSDNYRLVLTMNANLFSLGYVLSPEIINILSHKDIDTILEIYSDIVTNLKNIVGADVVYNPMYPNFPDDVMNISEQELWDNAITHYHNFGKWLPVIEKKKRDEKDENIEPVTIKLLNESNFKQVFTTILSSNDSISYEDKEIVEWFFNNYDLDKLDIPSVIPYKENLSLVAGILLEKGKNITNFIGNGTDVMRIYAYLSGYDTSLSEKIKFKSLPRKKRRILTKALDKKLTDDDLKRRPNMWTRMLHELHVGDFSNTLYQKAKKVRENHRIVNTSSLIEHYMDSNQYENLIDTLKNSPGDFARRLNEVLVKFNENQNRTVSEFNTVINSIPTRLLIQLWGFFKSKSNGSKERYVFPKGLEQKAVVINKNEPEIDIDVIKELIVYISEKLIERFSGQENLGKVYIDERLLLCPVPMQQRSASTSKFTVARGTKIPMEDNRNTLRFFVYWKGDDIDLSASFHDENFGKMQHISYTNIRDKKLNLYHSGDITSARHGASEFIDVDINKLLENNIRYVVMNVYVYNGPTFKKHDCVYAGWMTRDHPKSNEVYEPSTVKQKIDIDTNSYVSMPVIFDLVEREAIWCDISSGVKEWGNHEWKSGNNIEAHKAKIEDMLKLFTDINNKVTLYELFSLHAKARSNGIVDNKDDADFIFSLSMDDGHITPYHINDIVSYYLV